MANYHNIDRRTCLSSIGALGVGSVGFGSLGTGAAASDRDPIQQLDGRAADRALSSARNSDAFRTLRSAVVADGYGLQEQNAVPYRVSPIDGSEDQSYRAVIFEFSTGDGQQSVEMGIPVDGNSTQAPRATVERTADDGFPLGTEEFLLGSISTSENATDNRLEGVSVETEQMVVRGSTVTKRTTDLSEYYAGMDLGGQNDDITTNIPDDKCDTGSTMPCWGCKDLVAAVNVVTCGTAVWLICGAISIPTGGLGGLGCGIAVGLVCWAISHYGTNNPTEVCQLVCACP